MSEENTKEEEEKVEDPKATKESAAVETKEEEVATSDSSAEKVPEKKEETAADLLGANIEQVKVRKAKGSKNISTGICFIVATFNNTKVSFRYEGKCGFLVKLWQM